jgi:hypothetical protein
MAIDALHHMQNVSNLAIQISGSTTRNEKRCYPCPETPGFHLSSKEARTGYKLAA